jgi:hypothetical protein
VHLVVAVKAAAAAAVVSSSDNVRQSRVRSWLVLLVVVALSGWRSLYP